MPPREGVTNKYKVLNNPINNSPARPDAWRHRVPVQEETDIVNVALDAEPKTYQDVLDHPQSEEWLKSMQDEIDQLNSLQTFEIVDLPPGRKPIACKWVYRNKTDTSGSIACRKS